MEPDLNAIANRLRHDSTCTAALLEAENALRWAAHRLEEVDEEHQTTVRLRAIAAIDFEHIWETCSKWLPDQTPRVD